MPSQRSHCYEFGSFRLDPDERLLVRHEKPIALPPKAFETLLILVQNSGHVLKRDELIRKLWPDTFVEENNLTQNIALLRRALGGSNGNSCIETVPRLGYRFVMPVREVPVGGPELFLQHSTRLRVTVREESEQETCALQNDDSSAKTEPWDRRVPTAQRWIRIAGLVVAAAAVLVAAAALSGRFSLRRVPPRTVAVLPFRNLKSAPESQFLSLSLADAVISRLAYVSAIVVRPTSLVAKYQDGGRDPLRVAKELRVQTVLTGNYIKEGDRLRISAELVDVANGDVLWHETLDLPYEQLLTVQDRVAEDALIGLEIKLLPQEAQRLKQTAPKNALAYEYFLRSHNVADYRVAIKILESSLQLDPDYAPAWMKLGVAYAGYASWQGGGPEAVAKSDAAFDKALHLDPELPLLHTYIGVQLLEHGKLEEGLVALRQELRMYPNEATAHWWLTEAYLYGGMLPESIAEGEQALRLDPWVNSGSTLNAYLHAGEYDKFLATLPAGENARTGFYRGLCFFYKNDFPRASEEFQHAYALDPSLLHAKYGKALLFAIQRQSAEGLRYMKEVEQQSATLDGEMLYKSGQIYAVLGDKASALRSLRAAVEHDFYCYACFSHDPLLVSLHSDSQYAQLLELVLERHNAFQRKYF
jgi:DNA-binding winged helix-turn-helix (wHTH) protein/TolB-like protein/Tfp pilus assembly protein PilF